ncbi:teashirt homolog 2 [Hyperolius riggenbachi]|uniref:teashirt homolog 2 n=1 Tax=Hyperolius riggenbachi TaxID=752182 RepID=UPI0035A31E2E
MPRRKQQAPKRAAGYVQDGEDLKEDSVKDEEEEDDDSSSTAHLQDSAYSPTDEEQEVAGELKRSISFHDSPASHTCNQDGENESLLSDASDHVADMKSLSSSKDAQDQKTTPPPRLQTEAQDCIDKMKVAYANILSDSYWKNLGLSLKSPHVQKKTCETRNGTSKGEFDWHQDALTKSLQQSIPAKSISKPNLFSSVQLYRQNSKMYGTVFTGASRFRCRQCSAAYDTLVELTVHMNETGHYQDDNHKKDKHRPASYTKSRKRAFHDMDKEDAQKVLKCMFCGDSFDSLQDLSVHMIKTKHYQKVPLKEPIPSISTKMVSSKKRVFEVTRPCSPDSTTGTFGEHCSTQKGSNAQLSSNNRYGYQNGASYTWQFEACKSQILKCMECGSSHDTLQQLTTHMMVTGHFLKVTNSASKKGKQLVLDPLAVEKMQSLSDSPSSDSQSKPSASSPSGGSTSELMTSKECKIDNSDDGSKDEKTDTSEEHSNVLEKPLDPALKYQYLREEDLEDASKEGGDILKSLENTVTSAINKAQNGAPSWSAYPSIHAAYQISDVMKPSMGLSSQVMQMRPTFSNKFRPIAPKSKSIPLTCNTSPEPHLTQVKEESEDAEVEKETTDEVEMDAIPADKSEESPKTEVLLETRKEPSISPRSEEKLKPTCEKTKPKFLEPPLGTEECSALRSSANCSPDIPCVNPLSALQSVLNNHLGKASESLRPSASSNSTSLVTMFQKSPVNRVEKPAVCHTPPRPTGQYLFETSDQPIDLTKSKNKKSESVKAQSCRSPCQKHALSDIADMVKILPKATTPKHVSSGRLGSMKLDIDSRRIDEVSTEVSSLHKRKGRQSNWNPQHLLILQAQFASSLFQTSEGKYLLSDLGPQERMQISKFTGLSMTTISHWLANVKYQLRKTGGTKFLKNMDKGHPVFYCSDCASQFRTPSSYINHLETHLGFQMKDMNRLAVEQQTKVDKEISRVAVQQSPQPVAGEEDTDSKFKCKLCCRTFASKHAVKLHLSKTHSKSPEHHSQFVAEVDEE